MNEQPPFEQPPFEDIYYDNARRFGEVHALLFANVLWLSVFLGASRTVDQYRTLLDDVDDIERSAIELAATLRRMIEERIQALEVEA